MPVDVRCAALYTDGKAMLEGASRHGLGRKPGAAGSVRWLYARDNLVAAPMRQHAPAVSVCPCVRRHLSADLCRFCLAPARCCSTSRSWQPVSPAATALDRFRGGQLRKSCGFAPAPRRMMLSSGCKR